MVHLVDQALLLFGPARDVYAEFDRRHPQVHVVDDVFLALTHASGVRSHLFTSATVGIGGPRLNVLGSAGAFVKYGMDPQEDALLAGAAPGGAGWGREAETSWGRLGAGDAIRTVESEPGDYPRFYAGVAHALATGAPPPVTAAEAVAMMDVLEAARVSARERRVVARARHGRCRSRPIRGGSHEHPAGTRGAAGDGRQRLPARADPARPAVSWRPCPTRRATASAICAGCGGARSTTSRRRISIRSRWPRRCADGGIRLRIGIADVDALVPKGSAIDAHAAENSTSVYTGVSVFPMLPDALSTDRTSLVEGGERLVVVTELEIGKDGAVRRHEIYRALAVNHAKLDYESVGAWLEGRGPEPDKIAADDALEAQLWLQDRAAGLLKRLREKAGVLDLDTVAVTPVAKDGVIESLRVTRKNRARDLIEDFMIAANGAVARFLAAAGRSAIRRVVREPRRWDRIAEIAASYGIRLPAAPDGKALSDFLAARRAADPLRFPDLSLSVVKLLGPGEYVLDRPGPADDVGHFGLSAPDYTHATAPNRRYADLVTQRLVKAAIAGAPAPYSDDELDAIARHCTERENAANKVERLARKSAAALLLERRIGATFDAIVTGVKRDATYVRLLSPPAEGRVVRGEGGMDVGERVRVRLVRTDAERGHIDFEGI